MYNVLTARTSESIECLLLHSKTVARRARNANQLVGRVDMQRACLWLVCQATADAAARTQLEHKLCDNYCT